LSPAPRCPLKAKAMFNFKKSRWIAAIAAWLGGTVYEDGKAALHKTGGYKVVPLTEPNSKPENPQAKSAAQDKRNRRNDRRLREAAAGGWHFIMIQGKAVPNPAKKGV